MNKKKDLINEYRRYYLPIDFPVVLIDGSNWVISDIPSDRLHFHNCMEIGICHSHSGTLEILSKEYHFEEGDISCIPRNLPHTTYSDEGKSSLWSYIFFSPSMLFKGSLMPFFYELDVSKSGSQDFKFLFKREEYPFIYNLIMEVLYELREKKDNYQMVVKCLLYAFYIKLQRIQENAGYVNDAKALDDLPVAIRAVDYIEDNYFKKLTIESLADECGVSCSHFRRLFFSVMNIAPLNYLNSIRVSKACNLLVSTNDTIVQIAEEVGFFSVANFNRNFKTVMNMTPREYKKRVNNNEVVKPRVIERSGWTQPEKPHRRES